MGRAGNHYLRLPKIPSNPAFNAFRELKNCLIWKGSLKAISPTMNSDIYSLIRLLRAPWMSPMRGHIPPLWTSSSSASPPYCKKFPYIQSAPCFSLKKSPLVLSQWTLLKSLSSPFLKPPLDIERLLNWFRLPFLMPCHWVLYFLSFLDDFSPVPAHVSPWRTADSV